MSEHYHDPADLRFLKEMGKVAPTEFNAWLNLDNCGTGRRRRSAKVP
jgi:hypothetical protein